MAYRKAVIATMACMVALCVSGATFAQNTDAWWPQAAQDLVERLVLCDEEIEKTIASVEAAIFESPPDIQALQAAQSSIQEQLEEARAARSVSREQFNQADPLAVQAFSYTGQWTRSLITGLQSLAATADYALDMLQQPDSGGALTKDQAYMIRLGVAIAEACKNGALLSRSSCIANRKTNILAAYTLGLLSPTADRPAEPEGWQRIATWSGSGLKTTEPFTVTSSPWRVSWKAKATGDMITLFQVLVRPIGGGPLDMVYIANSTSEGEDTSYVYLDPGEYYIEIMPVGCRWTVTVEERQ